MATVTITFDTKTKALAASMDGASIENVLGCYIMQSYDEQDEFRCELMTGTHDKESDVRTYTRIVAAETKDGKAIAAAGAEVVNEFVAAYAADPKELKPREDLAVGHSDAGDDASLLAEVLAWAGVK